MARNSHREVITFTMLTQKVVITGTNVRKIHYKKFDPNLEWGVVRLRVYRGNPTDVLLHEAVITHGEDTMVRNWGNVYVEVKATKLNSESKARVYVHVEWGNDNWP